MQITLSLFVVGIHANNTLPFVVIHADNTLPVCC